jgi:hypothetical protein
VPVLAVAVSLGAPPAVVDDLTAPRTKLDQASEVVRVEASLVLGDEAFRRAVLDAEDRPIIARDYTPPTGRAGPLRRASPNARPTCAVA